MVISMETKHSSGVIAVVLVLATLVVMSVGISMNAYAQNTTQTADMAGSQATSNMTNITGLGSNIGVDDDADEGEEYEEGPGEDKDEPGDIDTNDEED